MIEPHPYLVIDSDGYELKRFYDLGNAVDFMINRPGCRVMQLFKPTKKSAWDKAIEGGFEPALF